MCVLGSTVLITGKNNTLKNIIGVVFYLLLCLLFVPFNVFRVLKCIRYLRTGDVSDQWLKEIP